MSHLDSILNSHEASKIAGNSEKLEKLMNAPETKQIFSMLNQNTGGNLEAAAGNAAKGDSTQLMSAINQLMQNPEAAKLISQMKSKLK